MMLKKIGFIDYLIIFSSSDEFLPIWKGGNINKPKNQNLSNLKLMFFQNNIEGFKQFCNFSTFL
jgi:hypothetical protein